MKRLRLSILCAMAILTIAVPTYLAVARDETGGFGGSIWQRGAATQQQTIESRRRKRLDQPAVSRGAEVQQATPDCGATRTMLADGAVEIAHPGGATHRFHPNGSITTIFPDGKKTERQPRINAQKSTPPLSLLSQPMLRPWLESHNNNLFRIIEGLFTAGEREKALANLRNAERGMTLYQQIDFRIGAINSLRK